MFCIPTAEPRGEPEELVLSEIEIADCKIQMQNWAAKRPGTDIRLFIDMRIWNSRDALPTQTRGQATPTQFEIYYWMKFAEYSFWMNSTDKSESRILL